mmetsp:Transcript_26242/g.69948  ORF Transcript_26242/g.69948 Transcript_26242/m.69948 type:complete len:221 (+) Transcript_26242:828-1490(+)
MVALGPCRLLRSLPTPERDDRANWATGPHACTLAQRKESRVVRGDTTIHQVDARRLTLIESPHPPPRADRRRACPAAQPFRRALLPTSMPPSSFHISPNAPLTIILLRAVLYSPLSSISSTLPLLLQPIRQATMSSAMSMSTVSTVCPMCSPPPPFSPCPNPPLERGEALYRRKERGGGARASDSFGHGRVARASQWLEHRTLALALALAMATIVADMLR